MRAHIHLRWLKQPDGQFQLHLWMPATRSTHTHTPCTSDTHVLVDHHLPASKDSLRGKSFLMYFASRFPRVVAWESNRACTCSAAVLHVPQAWPLQAMTLHASVVLIPLRDTEARASEAQWLLLTLLSWHMPVSRE